MHYIFSLSKNKRVNEMQTIVIRCKKCGKKLLAYNQGGFRKYKSPVKQCKSCGIQYADPRCCEIALEGIPADVFSVSSYVVMAILGALILYRGIYLFGMHQLGVPNGLQWLLPSLFTICGAILVTGGIIEIISIKTGNKAEKFERLKRDSETRMNDRDYVHILQSLGYKIPEKYYKE